MPHQRRSAELHLPEPARGLASASRFLLRDDAGKAHAVAAKSQGQNRAQQFAAATRLNLLEYRRPLALALPFAPEGPRHVPIGSSRSILTRLLSWAKGSAVTRSPVCLTRWSPEPPSTPDYGVQNC